MRSKPRPAAVDSDPATLIAMALRRKFARSLRDSPDKENTPLTSPGSGDAWRASLTPPVSPGGVQARGDWRGTGSGPGFSGVLPCSTAL